MSVGYTAPVRNGAQTPPLFISPTDILGDLNHMGAMASAGYPLANLALYVPFSVSHPVTVLEGYVFCGATGGGNFDIGIYSAAGSRLTSSGSTARVANDIVNTTAMGDLTLVPDTRYYMAFSADGTNNYIAGSMAAGIYEAMGLLESTSSFALPSSPTLSRTTRAFVPYFGLRLHSVAL